VPADFIIATGDKIKVLIPPPAVVPQLQAPVPLIGSSSDVMVNNNPACLKGDELPMALLGPLPYTAPPYGIPGTGKLTIILLPTNLTQQTSNQKPVLIKGSTFQALFTVQTPATMPSPGGPLPDPLMVKQGTAQFITSNTIVKAG
jgi:hypothetical protein